MRVGTARTDTLNQHPEKGGEGGCVLVCHMYQVRRGVFCVCISLSLSCLVCFVFSYKDLSYHTNDFGERKRLCVSHVSSKAGGCSVCVSLSPSCLVCFVFSYKDLSYHTNDFGERKEAVRVTCIK